MNISSVTTNYQAFSKTKAPFLNRSVVYFGQGGSDEKSKNVAKAYNKMISVSLKAAFDFKEPTLKKLYAETKKIFQKSSQNAAESFKNKVEKVFSARKILDSSKITAESVANLGDKQIAQEHKDIIENYDKAVSDVMEVVSTEATIPLITGTATLAEPFDTIYKDYRNRYKPLQKLLTESILDWYKAKKANKEPVPQWHMDLLEKILEPDTSKSE